MAAKKVQHILLLFNPLYRSFIYFSSLITNPKVPGDKNTLSAKMTKISQLAKLSTKYTNHSIRATCITLLNQAGVEARHIMRISGHRSESSIRSYSHRLSKNKKREISETLSPTMGLAIQETSLSTLPPIPTSERDKAHKQFSPMIFQESEPVIEIENVDPLDLSDSLKYLPPWRTCPPKHLICLLFHMVLHPRQCLTLNLWI